MNIRGHHLLCIFGYKGHGYNSSFCKNIAKVIDYLKNNCNDEFTVVIGFDIICENCPHLINEKCAKNGSKTYLKIKQHDLKVLKILNIKPGSRLSFDSLKVKIKNAKINPESICTGCEWLDLAFCKEGLSSI